MFESETAIDGPLLGNRPNDTIYLSMSPRGRGYPPEDMEPPAKRSSRRLLFDRRYGWVVDEWKDPSAEALAGGRGMFCLVPLGKTLFQTASQSINSAVNVKLQKWTNPIYNPKSSPETDVLE